MNKSVYSFFQFLCNNTYFHLNENVTVEIQANELNVGLKIISEKLHDDTLIDYIKLYDVEIVYLQINDITYIKKYYKCLWGSEHIVYRSPETFCQNDDIVKTILHKKMQEEMFSHEDIILNYVFIGGEMYGYQKFIPKTNVKKICCYSDYQSIVDDTIKNLDTREKTDVEIKYVKYDSLNLEKHKNKDGEYTYVICNNGKGGLYNLSYEINKIYATKIMIISCNEKSFAKDYDVLKTIYTLDKLYKINNVTLYVLEKHDM